ncbi:hypothetical protein PviCFBP13515_18185 [Pseudomonas viridiflava]|nr:hypothetical protein PviCFBP13507_22290 [Pseudomonas viridiflava]TKK24958.1 hypothetical protein PviCFBP13515_18185 [Pseudomonas viridiflava]
MVLQKRIFVSSGYTSATTYRTQSVQRCIPTRSMGTISVRLMIVSGRSASALECDAERHGGGMPTRSMGTIGVMVMIVPTLCVVTPLRTLRVRPCGDA